LLERLERRLPQVDLHRLPRRLRDELFVGSRPDDAPEQPIGFVGLSARKEQLGELEIHGKELVVLVDGGAKLGDRSARVLLLPVHLAELSVSLGIFR
jgi:hypothetical protein